MAIWFDKEDIGKKFEIKKKDGEVIIGILLDFDPLIKINTSNVIKRFLETKIDEVTEIKDNPLDVNVNISKTPISEFLDKLNNISIDFKEISFKELKDELSELKKEDYSLYLELQRIFNSLKYAYENNQMEFKYDKTNRLLYELDSLYKYWDDELIDKFIVFILEYNKVSYTKFFNKEPEKNYYWILLYDFYYYYRLNKIDECFLIGNIFFSEFPIEDEVLNHWLFLIDNIFQFKNISILEAQLDFFDDFSKEIKNIYKLSLVYLIYKFNIPLNDLQREYLKNVYSLNKKELIELYNVLDIYINPTDGSNIKIKEVKERVEKFIKNFEYLEAYEYIKSIKNYFNNSEEFNNLKDKVNLYYQNWLKYKDQLPSNSPNYVKAKKAQLIENNYEKAKFYFELSIEEKEEKFKSAIKDYIQMSISYDKNNVIKLIEKYKSYFEKEDKIKFQNITLPIIKNFDENMYLQALNQTINQISSKDVWIKKYKKIYLQYLIEASKIYIKRREYQKALKYLDIVKKNANEGNYLIQYNVLLAQIYMDKEDFNKAKKILEKNIKNYNDSFSKELLEKIEANIFDESIKIDNSISRLNISNFLNYYIQQCTFIGVSSTKAKTKKFTQKDLDDVLNLKDIKSAKEKADRYLTAYIISKSLKQEKNEYLAKSLRLYANYYISQNKFDIGKNYLIASLSVKYNEKVLLDYFKVVKDKDIFRDEIIPSLKDFLKFVNINDEFKVALTYLYFFVPDVFNYLEIKEQIIKEYIEHFNEVKYFLNLLESKDILFENIEDNINLNKFFLLDKDMFKSLKDIIILIKDYKSCSDSYSDRIYLLEKILNKLNSLKSDIESKLTCFGAIILGIISKLNESINNEIENLKISRSAKLTLDSPIDRYNKNENIEFHLSITNEKGLAPATINLIKVYKDNELIEEVKKQINIKDAESITIPIPLGIATDTFSVRVVVEYESCGFKNEVEEILSINVEDEEFNFIDNPYTPDGQIVKNKEMFFGREELLKDLVEKFNNDKMQALVLYGQKRVGKSTVFYYLQEELSKNFFIINFYSLGSIESIEEFIEELVLKIEDSLYDQFNEDLYDIIDLDDINFKNFVLFLKKFNKYLQTKNLKLLILIDEFTYLYEYIKKGKIDVNFLYLIKAWLQENLFKLGVIGQNSMPLFINDFPNPLAVFKKVKISYLSKKYSFDLLEQPILLNGKSRYKDNSLEYIYELTNGNPFYLQKIGYEIVEFLNKKRFNYITRATVEEVINNMFEKMTLEGDFDNIISLGNGANEEDEKLRKEVILQIAKKSKYYGSVDIDDIEINVPLSKKLEIIQSLIDTDVISISHNRYYLNVKLLEKYIQNKYGGI